MTDGESQIDGLLQLMGECAAKLPLEWERDFWIGSAYTLAELIANTRGRLSTEEQGIIVGTGGMLLRQAFKEQEAAGMLDALLSSLTGDAA